MTRQPEGPTRPAAVLLSLHEENDEMQDLVATLGYDVRDIVVQRRRHPDARTYLGRGKLRTVAQQVGRTGAGLVIVNDQLAPGQIFRIEQQLMDDLEALGVTPDDLDERRPLRPRGNDSVVDEEAIPRLSGAPLEVYDRVRVILEIFRSRASSQEAKLQVELARLRYEMPLVREAIHLAKMGEHPGFLAGGAYGVDQYYERIQRRMSRIRAELDHLSDDREVRRRHRRRGGFHLVSLAGYTNAGKSSLLQQLTDETTLVEDRLFSTLATRTRRMPSDRRDILVTDTVGFIEDLPPWLVEAFHSTLEEIALADIILLVVDASDEPNEVARKLESSLDVLRGFASRLPTPGDGGDGSVERGAGSNGGDGASDPARTGLAPIVTVLNKTDLLDEAVLGELVEHLQDEGHLTESWLTVSARTGAGLDGIPQAIYDALPPYDAYEVVLPQGPQTESFLAWLHEEGDVRGTERGEGVHVRFEMKPRLAAEVATRLRDLEARVLLGPDGHTPHEGSSEVGRVEMDGIEMEGAPKEGAKEEGAETDEEGIGEQ